MAEAKSTSSMERNYSAFDVELTHQALNIRMFIRLLGWMKPYRKTLFVSIGLVVMGAIAAVMLPVVTGRVIIDSILLPSTTAESLPDYGMIGLMESIRNLLQTQPLSLIHI